MGRTLPSQIQLIQLEQEKWRDFRRTLRKEDQEAFDALWNYARRYAASAAMTARPLPFEAHCLCMLLGLQREIEKIRGENDRGGT